jgi:hypothetical protein
MECYFTILTSSPLSEWNTFGIILPVKIVDNAFPHSIADLPLIGAICPIL